MVKLILAPMAAVSHGALRTTVARFGGCDEYYSEMIQAGAFITGGRFEKYYAMPVPDAEHIVWQLTGSKTEHLSAAAAQICQNGGAGVDINMGCCAPDIYRFGAGIAWMMKPLRETASMLSAVRSAAEAASCKRLSVKIRLGDEGFTESGFLSFCGMLSDCGVQVIALHPRTRKEKYGRPPRWEYAEKLCGYLKERHSTAEVVLNGAVHDRKSLSAALKAAPSVSGIMIGRAAVQKPWIFADMAEYLGKDSLKGTLPGTIDLYETVLYFLDDLVKYQPSEFLKTRMQRFFSYFSDNVQFAHHLKTQLLNCCTPDEVRMRLARYFEQVPDDRFAACPEKESES